MWTSALLDYGDKFMLSPVINSPAPKRYPFARSGYDTDTTLNHAATPLSGSLIASVAPDS